MKQIAKRVYNNNVVLSENASGEEIILGRNYISW